MERTEEGRCCLSLTEKAGWWWIGGGEGGVADGWSVGLVGWLGVGVGVGAGVDGVDARKLTD